MEAGALPPMPEFMAVGNERRRKARRASQEAKENTERKKKKNKKEMASRERNIEVKQEPEPERKDESDDNKTNYKSSSEDRNPAREELIAQAEAKAYMQKGRDRSKSRQRSVGRITTKDRHEELQRVNEARHDQLMESMEHARTQEKNSEDRESYHWRNNWVPPKLNARAGERRPETTTLMLKGFESIKEEEL